MEPELTWAWRAEIIDKATLTHEGIMTLGWAVDVVREFFGQTWLADNAARTGFVPLLHPEWIANPRAVVRRLELAARKALVTQAEDMSALLREAKNIYANRDLAQTKFEHLCLILETGAFATLAGWTISYENTTTAGRRPDLTMSRCAASYAVEVTTLALDREFRTIDDYCDRLHSLVYGLELEHRVEITCDAGEVLADNELNGWPAFRVIPGF